MEQLRRGEPSQKHLAIAFLTVWTVGVIAMGVIFVVTHVEQVEAAMAWAAYVIASFRWR